MQMYVAINNVGEYATASTSPSMTGSRKTVGVTTDINKATLLPMKYMDQGWDSFDTRNVVAYIPACETRIVTLQKKNEQES